MKRRDHGAILDLDGNTVRLNRRNIEIYVTRSFWGKDAAEADAAGYEYFRALRSRLEGDLNVVLSKPRVVNSWRVAAHYAETENEIAIEANKKHEKIALTTDEDGKIWALVDNSFNLNEFEFIHPKTSRPDTDEVRRHLNDIRFNKPPTNSELMGHLGALVKNTEEVAAELNVVVTLIRREAEGRQESPVSQESERGDDSYIG
jgi:hypothetical protein